MTSNGTISTGSDSALPNPYTVLAFLPSTLADQFQATCYVIIACLAAFIWEWLASMADEYRILRGGGLSLPIFAYFLSRIGTLGYCVTTAIFQAAPVTYCQTLLYISGSFLMLSQASTSLLFFVRVKAVYSNSKIITGVFGLAWLINLALSVSVPLAVDGDHIGPTNRCITTNVRPYASVPIIVNTTYDTLIFLSISYKIVSRAIVGENFSTRMKSFLTGQGLPWLSKGLLQGGQIYYFATVILSIVMCALVFSPNIPGIFKGMFSVPTLALPSIMACRVFRAVKLGGITELGINSSSRTPISRVHFTNTCEIPLQVGTFDASRNNMEITTTTDVKGDIHDYAFRKPISLTDENVNHPSDLV